MKHILKTILISAITVNSAYAQLKSTINFNKESIAIKNTTDFMFNYYAQYTGPSLGGNYQSGATYNRFDGGTGLDGKRYDTTGSQQIYQSFKVGYKLPKNLLISYSVTYQDNLKKGIEYNNGQNQRDYGRSFNNHRISLWIPTIISGSKASLSASVFYERPTYKVTNDITESDYSDNSTQTTVVDSEYQYGLGFQPTLSIYSNIPGLYHGLTASIERYVFPENTVVVEKDQYWCARNNNCAGIAKNKYQFNNQGLKANIGGYLNYMINDLVTFKSSIQFDWDQVGDQVGTFNEFGNNMDNIGNLGLSFSLTPNITFASGVNFSLEEAGLDKTAIQTSLNITI